jgi:O-acetyl-ADP-ribose deacetylase (regulator of RNase III)
LKIASGKGIATMAFPNISTGVYRFPKEQAAGIAISEVRRHLAKNDNPVSVFFVCFDDENFNLYNELLKK